MWFYWAFRLVSLDRKYSLHRTSGFNLSFFRLCSSFISFIDLFLFSLLFYGDWSNLISLSLGKWFLFYFWVCLLLATTFFFVSFRLLGWTLSLIRYGVFIFILCLCFGLSIGSWQIGVVFDGVNLWLGLFGCWWLKWRDWLFL